MLIKLVTLLILSYNPYQKFIEVNNNQESEMMKHPIAKKIPYSFEIHDTKIDDEYNWLRGKGWPEKITDKDILSYLTEENDYFNHFMDPLAREKELIFDLEVVDIIE